MAGSAREEAERLVASVLARAVTGQAFGERWATGEPECCVCPVCKAIAAMRDPKPETAARLAGGAGDLAGSVAGLLRSVSAIVGERSRPAPPPSPPPAPNADQAWSVATRADHSGADRIAADRDNSGQAWAAATDGEQSEARGNDPWAAATTVSAAGVAARHAAELAERRAAALRAAAEAERRVAEAAALAKARREAERAAASAAGETGDTAGPVARDARTPRRLDVWAAATADAGVAPVASGAAVDHDVAGDAVTEAPSKAGDSGATGPDEAGGAPGEVTSEAASGDTDAEGDGGTGDEARDGGAA
ncbi:hypothetical protein [Actinoplanes sp. M2I2]|uniref:hypothetical protein n=1 Tax=Actinoplanes sp. M2I2 TaxID=1734444 RepID=UPI0035B393A9